MNLNEILEHVHPVAIAGPVDREISTLTFDSREVIGESVFFAIPGTQVDGHKFIDKAIANGAAVIVAEKWPEERTPGPTWLRVSSSAEALGRMASNFYGRPSHDLRLVGVTGTNGKTTVTTLLYQLFAALGYKTGLLSTIENKIGERSVAAQYTTPDALGINALLSEMCDAGCDYVFMEVSSHAAHQRRIAGLRFAGGVFTNITHDHLDYHKTFQAYIEAKKSFFDGLPAGAFALVNSDDKRGDIMVQNTAATPYRFSLQRMADFRARIVENTVSGLHLDLDGLDFYSRLIGDFNAYNLLAVYATALLLGQDRAEVLPALSDLRAAEGRFDFVAFDQAQVVGLVDYAHTPDALEKVLKTIQQVRPDRARTIVVIGCGGDRDRAKRPEMAKVACTYGEEVVLTSDNPRSEPPEAIIAEMEKGVPPQAAGRVLAIVDRRQAIRTACRLARPGDIVLVAGKGHEKYQEIQGERRPFDDKAILKQELTALAR